MRDVTRETLVRLSGYAWFSRVLTPLGPDDDGVGVGSWEEAVRLAAGEVWESVQLQTMNRLSNEVNRLNYPRFVQWNALAVELRGALAPIVEAHVEPVARRYDLPKSFVDSVEWDLLSICLEAEYADVYPPLFYLSRLDGWYQRGRFPCGWKGPVVETGGKGSLPEHKLFIL